MELLFVRHGEMAVRASDARDLSSVNRIFNQEAQGGLTPRGVEQAELVARYLKRTGAEALYSSPLTRAKQTADSAATALSKSIEVRDELRELATGHLPATSRVSSLIERVGNASFVPEAARRNALGAVLIPLYFQAWRRGRTIGGETPAELEARIDDLLALLRARHSASSRIALFCHGYLMFILALRAGSRSDRLRIMRRPYIPNGGITFMSLRGAELELVQHAYAEHLGG